MSAAAMVIVQQPTEMAKVFYENYWTSRSGDKGG
jgi:hypothetical protein